MALWVNEATSQHIEEWIEQLKGEFHATIRNTLQIEDMEYQIETAPVRIKDGYPEGATKASGIPNYDTNRIDRIVFFTGSISQSINSLFSKDTNSDEFYELAELFVKFVWIHELVHIRQLKDGMTFEEYFSTAYEDSQWEKEANQTAMELLQRFGGAREKVMKIFLERFSPEK
ncbi:hypothetical protein [Fontibacillus sp. BL9]|uniref:hypothetical protein n=1 Tax=Fontibacillus sp. BL9 TaxID=3389971 RepID=UPI00397C3B62